MNVKIVDPLAVRPGSYNLRIVPTEGNMNSAYWELTNANGGEIYEGVDTIRSSRPIGEINEEIIFELGLSIQLTNPKAVANSNAATITAGEAKGGDLIAGALLSSSITFAEPSKAWLTGVADNDALQSLDWIRAGGVTGADDQDLSNTWLDYFHRWYQYSDIDLDGDGNTPDSTIVKTPMDAKSEFEGCVGGWWAPYRLTSVSYNYDLGQQTPYLHPAFTDAYYFNPDPNEYDISNIDEWNPGKLVSLISNDMNNLASVDIVFTNDQSKWTRCPVIEMGNDPVLTQGNAKAMRKKNDP